MAVRVLCTGDIHIGRRSSKVAGIHSCADAWSRIVDKAIEENVDLLAISGDVIDEANKTYEAIGPLQHGLARLNHAGIETVAVTGNHDYDVLPRVVGITGTERFHLLGKGGNWERWTLARNDVPILHVDGWSFSKKTVTISPMPDYRPSTEDGIPILGLLHADLDNPKSAYCPVALSELRAHPVSLWLLGHIHKAKHEKLHAHASALYPGSPYAMDPGETGTHGYWLAEFEPSEPVRLAHIALSPVRYDAETVDVSAVVEEDEFRSVITDAMLRVGERAVSESGEGVVSVVSCRMELIGSCSAHHQLREWSTNAFNDLSVTVGTLVVGLDRVSQDVYPPIDLMERAKYNDPVGEAARLLLGLDLPIAGSPYSDLVGRTLRVLTDVHKHNAYGELKSKEDATSVAGPTEMDAVGLLKTQAWRIVSELVTAKAKA